MVCNVHNLPFVNFFQGSNLIQSKVSLPTEKQGDQPVVSFIQLERYNAIKLVQSIHGTLAALSKVIRGTQLLTNEVSNLAAALMNQEVGMVILLPSWAICLFENTVCYQVFLY